MGRESWHSYHQRLFNRGAWHGAGRMHMGDVRLRFLRQLRAAGHVGLDCCLTRICVVCCTVLEKILRHCGKVLAFSICILFASDKRSYRC